MHLQEARFCLVCIPKVILSFNLLVNLIHSILASFPITSKQFPPLDQMGIHWGTREYQSSKVNLRGKAKLQSAHQGNRVPEILA